MILFEHGKKMRVFRLVRFVSPLLLLPALAAAQNVPAVLPRAGDNAR